MPRTSPRWMLVLELSGLAQRRDSVTVGRRPLASPEAEAGDPALPAPVHEITAKITINICELCDFGKTKPMFLRKINAVNKDDRSEVYLLSR